MTTSIRYALDWPVLSSGGREHVLKALRGESQQPSNYEFAANDGTKLVYHVCGRGDTLLIAVAPGWGVGINYLPRSFKPLVDSGRFTFVCLQPRGSLPSERPQDATRMSSKHMAGDVDDLRRVLELDAINVIGHSSGATIMLAYAELFPSHCLKAVLIETRILGSKFNKIAEEVEKRQDDPRYIDAVKAFRARQPAKTNEDATEFMQNIFPLYFVEPQSGMAEFADQTGPLTVQVWAQKHQYAVDDLPEANLVDDLGKVTAEVLLISGEDDWICCVEESAQVKEEVGARARQIIYPGCGHMPWVEHKDGFFTDVTAFLLG